MIYLFLGSLALIAAGAYFTDKFTDRYSFGSLLASFASVGFAIAGMIGLAITMIAGFEYKGAEHRANIINREYGTEYTQEEVFYASNVIDIVRELDRKRYEINGDIRRQRDPQRDKYQTRLE